MAKRKIKLTRTELKAQRDALSRFKRYLPTLKLKQQQIQSSIVQMRQVYKTVRSALETAQTKVSTYQSIFNDVAGINIHELAKPSSVQTVTRSIAGVPVSQFESVSFPTVEYSLFVTPPWVDRALIDLREVNRQSAELNVVQTALNRLEAELKKVMQRVNLFEKIKIPETEDNIRRIRIAVGDQMTAGVARAKIAKTKLEQKNQATSGPSRSSKRSNPDLSTEFFRWNNAEETAVV